VENKELKKRMQKLAGIIKENKIIDSIDFDNIFYLGKGEFGKAYLIGNNMVLKLTSSKTEYEIANKILNANSKLYNDAFANIYEVGKYKNDYYIIMEELDTDSKIEDLYYELTNLLDQQNLPIQYVGYLEYNEDEISDELKNFINSIDYINRAYNNLGIEASDIQPDNLGYDKNNNLKAFDIDTKNK
jgi:hypothetical protein